MKTEIVLLHDGVLSKEEQEHLRYLLSDALHDFKRAREGGYIETRYAGQDAEFKARKARDVEGRVMLAGKLHNASLNPEVRVIDPGK